MAVKFEFTVDDIDAFTIFSAMQHIITDAMEAKLDEMSSKNRPEFIKWFDGHIKYLKDLETKMLNTHVEGENGDFYSI